MFLCNHDFLRCTKQVKEIASSPTFFSCSKQRQNLSQYAFKATKKITYLKILLFNQIQTAMICTFFSAVSNQILWTVNITYQLHNIDFFFFFYILLYAFVFEEKFFSFLFLVVYTNTIELNKIKNIRGAIFVLLLLWTRVERELKL